MNTLCKHGATENEDCRLCWLDRIEATKPAPGEFVEAEFLGWPYSEWELLRARWEKHYPGLRPSQVRLKSEDREGLNPPGPKFLYL